MNHAALDTILAKMSAQPPSVKAKACFKEARSLRASSEQLGVLGAEISRRASEDIVLADLFEHQALLFHAEVVGSCKDLYTRDSQIMCELPIGHKDEMHHFPGIGWGNPQERIFKRCWQWPCLRERRFDRFEVAREDGAKFWRYRDSKGHVHD